MGEVDVASGDTVLTGEKGHAGRVALCGVVELGKAEPIRSEVIEVGSVDFTSIASDIRVAEVIGHNHDHVW